MQIFPPLILDHRAFCPPIPLRQHYLEQPVWRDHVHCRAALAHAAGAGVVARGHPPGGAKGARRCNQSHCAAQGHVPVSHKMGEMMQPGALCCSEPRSGEAGWHLLASSRHAGCNCLFALQSRTLLAFHRTLQTRPRHAHPHPFACISEQDSSGLPQPPGLQSPPAARGLRLGGRPPAAELLGRLAGGAAEAAGQGAAARADGIMEAAGSVEEMHPG